MVVGLARKEAPMPSNIDIQRVMLALDESKLVRLEMPLRDIVASPAVGIINTVANLEPWELICYTWVTLIRRRGFNELVAPIGQVREMAALEEIQRAGR
jgi:hypothetical protein